MFIAGTVQASNLCTPARFARRVEPHGRDFGRHKDEQLKAARWDPIHLGMGYMLHGWNSYQHLCQT
jgi:hypothetical protein